MARRKRPREGRFLHQGHIATLAVMSGTPGSLTRSTHLFLGRLPVPEGDPVLSELGLGQGSVSIPIAPSMYHLLAD